MFDFEHRVGRLDAITTLNVLPASQRPRISSFHGIKDLCNRILESQLTVVVPHEKLASHRQTTEPDVLYGLLSKRYLALSGLPTPPSSVLDLGDCPGSVEQKLSIASSWIHSFAIPRVFKTQQGMSSVGTFIIRTESEREELVRSLSAVLLRNTLHSVNACNAHLYPSSLISQEMIKRESPCFATSFFVHRKRNCTFLGACWQKMSESNAWLGARIRYWDQDKLKHRLWRTICQISNLLRGKGYYGPAGADIIPEDARKRSSPRPWIIDLDVRMTGSLSLAFLRGHFSDRRGLDEACVTQRFKFRLNRNAFCTIFAAEIQAGRMVIVAWFDDMASTFSWGTLALGGEDSMGLDCLMGRVKALAMWK